MCFWQSRINERICRSYPMGTLRCFDVDTPSIRRRDGISTLYRRRSNVVCPLGTGDFASGVRRHDGGLLSLRPFSLHSLTRAVRRQAWCGNGANIMTIFAVNYGGSSVGECGAVAVKMTAVCMQLMDNDVKPMTWGTSTNSTCLREVLSAAAAAASSGKSLVFHNL